MEINKPKAPIRLSRADLYEQVWKVPLIRLGRQYGITGTGLAKICVRLDVPYPPAGYWLRVNAGKSPKKAGLPPARDGIPNHVIISPTPERPKVDPETEANFAEALEKLKAVEVCENLRGQHPVVAALIAEHDRNFSKAKREQRAWGASSSRVGPLTELDHRRHRILNTFLKEVGKAGFSVLTAGGLQIGKNRVDFTLEEYRRQFRRPLKPEERPPFNPDQEWTQEKATTGELRFKFLTTLGPGFRSLWTDALDVPLENWIKDILATLIVAVPFLEQRRVAEEEAERVRIEAEQKLRQETARRRTERNQWRRLLELSERWDGANRVRLFVAAIEAKGATETSQHGGRSHDEWLTWVKERLAAYDPFEAGVDSIWSNMGRVTSWEYND
jgi:hypothetical protein